MADSERPSTPQGAKPNTGGAGLIVDLAALTAIGHAVAGRPFTAALVREWPDCASDQRQAVARADRAGTAFHACWPIPTEEESRHATT